MAGCAPGFVDDIDLKRFFSEDFFDLEMPKDSSSFLNNSLQRKLENLHHKKDICLFFETLKMYKGNNP